MTTRVALFLAALVTPSFAAIPSHGAIPLQVPPIAGFVPNQGQAPAQVLYYAAIPGGMIYLMRDAVIIDRWRTERESPPADSPHARRVGSAVRLRFSGQNPGAILAGAGHTDSRLNFFIGADRTHWHSDVPVYESASYRDLWPGLDLTFTFDRGTCACALDAKAGADIDRARFEMQASNQPGSELVGIAALTALLEGGAGPGELDNPGALVWSTYLGGSAEESGWSATFDAGGNVIVTGLNTSTFFPTTPGAYDRTYSGLGDVFVSKLSASGTTLLWSTFLGGTALQFDYGYAVDMDPSNNPVVTGYTRSEDFPVTPGAYDTQYNGEADVFVSKLSADGSSLLWSTFIGGPQHDIGYDIDHDSEGNPVVAGRSLSDTYPTTPGAYDPTANGEEDGFVTKLSGLGNALIWSTMLGGSLYDGVQAIQVNNSSVSYVCGYTASTDFPGGSAVGLYDIFVAKLSAGGNALNWSRLVGGSSYDYGTDLTLDSAGNPVICGSTGSSDFPVTPGAYDTSYNGDDDVIAAKLAATDGSIQWATFVGGTAPVYEIAHGIVLDSQDRPILAGATPSADFPTTPSGFDTSHNGASDVFVVRLNASGSALEWGSFFGGPGDDYAFGLAIPQAGGPVVVTGAADAGYPVTANAYDPTYNGDISDVFVSKVNLGSASGIAAESPPVNPLSFSILPNPITAGARIAFALPGPAAVRIDVFDAMGRLCATIHDAPLGPGAHSLEWGALDRAGRPLPSGVYAVRLTAGNSIQSRRAVLVR
jgi:hypothetical protein